ncbi:MAG TPA: phytanoyl-CoA dioxygenase family protein [Pyrinomonadaceae bacterium]
MITDGYCISEDIISSCECDELLRFLAKLPRGHGRAGIRNLMAHTLVRSLAHDPRLIALTADCYGRQLVPYKATLFNKTAKANWLVAWHQDTALPIEEINGADGWSAPSVKQGHLFAQAPASALKKVLALRIHLDASTPTNGPLRVVPRSHLLGILSDVEINDLVNSSRQVECVVGRGGVIAMSPLLLHASSKLATDAPRRVLHIEYAESLKLAGDIRLVIS